MLKHSQSSLRRFTTPRQISFYSTSRAPPPTEGDAPEPSTSSPKQSGLSDQSSARIHDLALIKRRLQEWSDRAAIVVRNRADDFTANTKSTFSQLGSQLNRVTGYEEIEALKRQVVEQEARIDATRQAARQAKETYERAVVQRSSSQREVNDLLQRKSTWTDHDVSRFTTLVREDHLFEQEEARAKAAVDATETAVEREFSELMRSILGRYHEEQVWSDKIRSASTYGQMAALGLNLLVFIMAIVVVEPWKRRRLAQTFEKKIDEMGKENTAMVDAGLATITRQLEKQAQLLAVVTQEQLRDKKLYEADTFADTRAEVLVDAAEEIVTPQAKDSMLMRLQDRDVSTLLATSAVLAGVFGWLARGWLGSG